MVTHIEVQFTITTRATILYARETTVMETAMVFGYLVTNSISSKVRILLKLLSLLVDKREDNTLQLT